MPFGRPFVAGGVAAATASAAVFLAFFFAALALDFDDVGADVGASATSSASASEAETEGAAGDAVAAAAGGASVCCESCCLGTAGATAAAAFFLFFFCDALDGDRAATGAPLSPLLLFGADAGAEPDRTKSATESTNTRTRRICVRRSILAVRACNVAYAVLAVDGGSTRLGWMKQKEGLKSCSDSVGGARVTFAACAAFVRAAGR